MGFSVILKQEIPRESFGLSKKTLHFLWLLAIELLFLAIESNS